jgi:hypothetical protein
VLEEGGGSIGKGKFFEADRVSEAALVAYSFRWHLTRLYYWTSDMEVEDAATFYAI